MQRRDLHVDADGVTVRRTGRAPAGMWLLIPALALVGLMLVVIVGPLVSNRESAAGPEPPAQPPAHRSGSQRLANGSARSATSQAPAAAVNRRPQLPPAASQPRAADPIEEQLRAALADAAEAANAAGGEEPVGIELFPPPGTDPVKPGLIVPDDFELPPGYVRHYQTTDNGKQLPPILMFHPDYAPVDEHGNKVALPADRVVPPDMAPPGLPQQMLEVPDDAVPMFERPNERPAED